MSQAQPPQYPPPSSPPPPGYPPGSYPPPPGGGYPPGGVYPPGTNYAPQGTPMGSPKTSIAAVFSLVFGILGCIPLVTSILAIILGIVGIGATKNNQRSGRGLAIAGLLLGLLGVVLWSVFGGGIWAIYKGTGPVRAEGKQFIQYLVDGNVDAAHAQCTSAISRQAVQNLADYVKPLGALKDVTSFSAAANNTNGQATAELGGAATFDKGGAKPFTMSFVKVNGQWKVNGIQFEPGKTLPNMPAPATRP